jgi:DNA protecting protein DprA
MNTQAFSQAYWVLRLLNLPRVGNAKVRKILDLCKAGGFSVSEFIERILGGAEKTSLLEPGHLDELGGENRLVDKQWEALQEDHVEPLLFGTERYPTEKMHTLNNRAPVLLFAKGNLDLLEKPSLGFCGSRKASEKGLRTAWDIADQMARKGVNIVSGYASGVDMTTHRTALEAGGSTTIVLAEGILNFKIKKAIKELFDELRILVLSEFLPRLPWSVRNAMQRNSTICVLSDAMVLIEAEERGGSISAGRACLEMQRPLFAPVYEGMPKSATGNVILLEKGAHELKKSRRTDRANLIRIEQLLFRGDNDEKGYPADLNPDAEQLALFEDAAPYKISNKDS